MKHITITFQDIELFLEYKIDDEEVIWRADPSEYNDEHSYFINSTLSINHNDEVCDLIVEEIKKQEMDAELERMISESSHEKT